MSNPKRTTALDRQIEETNNFISLLLQLSEIEKAKVEGILVGLTMREKRNEKTA